jgi:predicted phosphodiesterase
MADGLPDAQERPDRGSRRLGLSALLLRVALVLVVAGGVFELQAAASFQVPAGTVTFRVRPAWPGGHLIVPLGPAGELALRTHRTPVDIVMDYRLPAQTAALLGGGSEELPRLEGGARAALTRFLAGRVPWLLVVGVAAGLLVTGRWTRRRIVWGAAGGAAAALLLGGAVVLASYATLDRSPSVRYLGLASRVPAMLPLLRALSTGGDQGDRLGRLQDFLDGLEAVATQLTMEPRRPARAEVVRLLLASDMHDNVFGARVAARLAAGGGEPVDAVLLAGDITAAGTAEEARLFLRVFGDRPAPVVFVGGNHEDAPALRVFRGAGLQVLRDSTATIGGVTVLGACDPVADDPRVASDVPALIGAGMRLAAVWRVARPRPHVVLVHDVRQAGDTIAAAKDDGAELLVAYGNDHVAGVSTDDRVVLVDAGTSGASGYEVIGAASPSPLFEPPAGARDVYTFQLLDFSRTTTPHLVALTTLTYAPGGRTVVTYTPFEP